MRFMGIDPGLNHAGFVQLEEDGSVTGWRFVTDNKPRARACPDRAVLIDLPKTDDPDLRDVQRLAWWDRFLLKHLDQWVLDPSNCIVGIEGYAFGKTDPGAFSTGELGGRVRLAVYDQGCRFRIYDPLTVKFFATGKGNATGSEVRDAVETHYNGGLGCKPNPAPLWLALDGKSKSTPPSEDLAAAYFVAEMVRIEWKLRAGGILLQDLAEHKIRAFNRVTKANPVNLLARNWVERAA